MADDAAAQDAGLPATPEGPAAAVEEEEEAEGPRPAEAHGAEEEAEPSMIEECPRMFAMTEEHMKVRPSTHNGMEASLIDQSYEEASEEPSLELES